MAEVIMGFTMPKPHIHNPPTFQTIKMEMNQFPKSLRKCSFSRWNTCWLQGEGKRSKRGSLLKANALPDWPLIAVLVQHIEGQRDYIVHKTVWHLNDETLKNVYTMYIMFTCWGCCFFGAMKDPYYDGEQYRKDGGDGTGHWVYEKQEDIEEKARAELWREELIEEIEQKVGGLRELEEAGKKKEEELV
ncbi:photosynthetic NDH subunit of subcomplex B 4, chloroplastic [Magnolia sinica]|uniref:photosynthetic NDH subunit of subcomplex B 4, chloroplastic n=1 Tax=Magnolia sinica TaxID=86752 RepID=UPI00265A855C|nr:photosynthetic NDH subunit of subcomplex B 4, chloroplastic [Magnolia sinica]